MVDEKAVELQKLYDELTPNEKYLVGIFVNGMILSRNRRKDRQSGNSRRSNEKDR